MGTAYKEVTAKFAKYINAMDYCYGDGQTDDTSNVSTAMAASVAAGAILYFPAGTYLADVTMTNGAAFYGESRDTTWIKGSIRPQSNNSFAHLKLGIEEDYFGSQDAETSVTNLRCYDCTFHGAKEYSDNGWQISFQLGVYHDILFESCLFLTPTAEVYDMSNIVVMAKQDSDAQDLYNITFRDCTFQACSRTTFEVIHGGSSEYTYPFHHITLDNCTFGDAGSQVVSYAGWGAHNNKVKNCSFANWDSEGSYGHAAIELNNVSYSTITGNTMTPTTSANIMLGQWTPTGTVIANHNFIDNNTFDGTGLAGSKMYLKGSDWTFTNNTVYAASGYSVMIKHAADATLGGNKFYAWDATGDELDSDRAVWIQNANNISFTGDEFHSENGTAPVQLEYGTIDADPDGYATNIDFTDCHFYRLTAAANVYKLEGSNSFSETNSTPHLLD